MKVVFFIFFVVVVGMLVFIQVVFNVKLGKVVGDLMYGVFFVFLVGMFGLLVYVLVVRIDLSQIQVVNVELWVIWLGGLCGVFFVVVFIIFMFCFGVVFILGFIVVGQMGFLLLVDYYGWFGMLVQEINWFKIGGVVFIVGGVWLVQLN